MLDVVRRRRVGPWRLRIVLRLARLLSSASNSGHPKAIFRLGKRICCLDKYRYIIASPSSVRSTSDIERGSVLRSLLLAYIHTNPSL